MIFYLHPVLGSARLYRELQHETADLEDEVVGLVQLVGSLVTLQSLIITGNQVKPVLKSKIFLIFD